MKLRRLGDTVLWTAALEALKRWKPPGEPEVEIDLALPSAYTPLFDDDPRFREIWGLKRGVASNLPVTREWRKRHYDYVLSFHASERSLLLAMMARGKERIVHHHSRKPKRFFSERAIVGLGKVMAASERDLNVVRTLGWNGESPPTRLYVSPERLATARQKLESLWGSDGRPLVLIGPTASRPAKQWALDRYAALAALLGDRARVGIIYESDAVFLGSHYLKELLSRNARLIPTPRLPDLMGLLAQASVYVGSDSGVKHIACALGTKTVTLFGPESLGEWHCYDRTQHRVIQKKVACRSNDPDPTQFAWCGAEVCPYASHACMSLITPEEVAAEIGCQLF